MTIHKTPTHTRWVWRPVVLLLVAATVSVSATSLAGAATPPPPPSAASATTSPAPAGTTTPADAVDRAPVVTVLPSAQTVPEGRTATLTASVGPLPGDTHATLHWQTALTRAGPWTDLAGQTGTTLAVAATPAVDGALYRATLATVREDVHSSAAILHVEPLPAPAAAAAPTLTPSCPTVAPAPDAPLCDHDPSSSTPDTGSAVPEASVTGPQYGTVAHSTLRAGEVQVATGHNFTPGALIHVTLQPDGSDLGTYTAGPDGTVIARFATTGLTVGTHTITWDGDARSSG